MVDTWDLIERVKLAMDTGEGMEVSGPEAVVLYRLMQESLLISDDLEEFSGVLLPRRGECGFEEWLMGEAWELSAVPLV